MNFAGANGKAMHTIDIPFMFDNIAMAEAQVGNVARATCRRQRAGGHHV